LSDETPVPKKSSSTPPKSATVRLSKPPARSTAKTSSASASAKATDKSEPVNAAKAQADARSLEKAICAAQAAIDKKGLGPVLLDLREQKSYTDYLLVVSGPGPRATKAVAESVQETLAEHGYRAIGVEGVREGRWALLDYGDLVVHVFDHPLREFYDLEGMWFDAPKVELQVPPEQRIVPGALSYSDEAGEGAY
jgi:ribosome-associated protein